MLDYKELQKKNNIKRLEIQSQIEEDKKTFINRFNNSDLLKKISDGIKQQAEEGLKDWMNYKIHINEIDKLLENLKIIIGENYIDKLDKLIEIFNDVLSVNKIKTVIDGNTFNYLIFTLQE